MTYFRIMVLYRCKKKEVKNMKKIAVVEISRDGSVWDVTEFETKEAANEYITNYQAQYERRGSKLVIW